LNGLIELDVSFNSIQSLNALDFVDFKSLSQVNLNSNQIIEFTRSSSDKFNIIKAFKLSKTKLSVFDLSLIKDLNRLADLDLSFNNISNINSIKLNIFDSLEKLRLRQVSLNSNLTFEDFLNPKLKELDLSDNNMSDFRILDSLIKIESLELSHVGLKSIDLSVFRGLIKLDLSRNRLTCLSEEHFSSLQSLEYLDVSSNEIASVDEAIFKYINNSRLINLDNNRISSIGDTLWNYLNISVLKLANNKLAVSPILDFDYTTAAPSLLDELHLNDNDLVRVSWSHVSVESSLLGQL
jgi:Leucine-rich repeat (LRR) protein